MIQLLEKQLVEEAVLLAETIAAVEARKDPRIADDVSQADFCTNNYSFIPTSPSIFVK